jgi:hypothetical protein
MQSTGISSTDIEEEIYPTDKIEYALLVHNLRTVQYFLEINKPNIQRHTTKWYAFWILPQKILK